MSALPVDCGKVPSNTTVDCSHPWAEGCTSKLHFEFPSIWNFTQRIHERCPTEPRLFKAVNGTSLPALTKHACEHIAGSDFNYYQSSVSWTRLTTWKFPLLQLLATFPRPPLGLLWQFFVMAHLLGDPIDTIKNLLLKLSKCQSRAERWKETEMLFATQDPFKRQSLEELLEQDRRWKAVALLSDAYDEWGKGDDSVRVMYVTFVHNIPNTNSGIADVYWKALGMKTIVLSDTFSKPQRLLQQIEQPNIFPL